MRRIWLALLVAGLAGLILAGPAAAHAQLVSSSPGAGQVVAEPPDELRLVFSEPVDPAFAGIDLLDADGVAIARDIGVPDAADPRVFVAELPPLGDGLYTANWQVLSAADGHVTSGFLTFGVGDVQLTGPSRDGGVGGLHGGHSPPVAVLDAASRAVGYAGAMLAFGLAVIGAAVMRPTLGGWPARAATWGAAALVLGALGAGGSIVVGVIGLAGEGSPGLVEYATATRTGALLLGQAAVGLVGAGLSAPLARRGSWPGLATTGAAGAACLVLTALRSHATGAEAAGPVAADMAHLAAAAIWISGLTTLVLLATGRLGTVPADALRRTVPRFSALALVSIGFVAATGLYNAWLQVGDPAALGTDYGVVLLAKLAVVAAALSVGGINYLDGGRNLPIAGGLRRRIGAELALAAVVILITANLTTGVPPAQLAKVTVPATGGEGGMGLALQPGTPGPNRALVSYPSPGFHIGTIELQLQRLDQVGTTRVVLRGDPTAAEHGTGFVADGVLLPAGSRWTAAAVTRDPDGVETGRTGFAFALDDRRVIGPEGFHLDPGLLVAAALIIGAVVGLGYWLGGGRLPRTDPRLGRVALLVGGLAGLALGVVLLLWGPMS